MDWKHTFKTFYEGETDDTFIPTGNKYLSSSNIDPSSNPRYLQLSERLVTTDTETTTADLTDILALPGGSYVYTGSGNVFFNSIERTSTIGGSGYTFAHYLYNTSSALKVFVFGSGFVYRMNSDLSTNEASIAIASGTVTAVCQATNTLVFAIGSVIYQLTNASTLSTVVTTLPYGITVKKLYFYNDILYIFAQDGVDTKVYQYRYNGTTYDLLYWHTKEDISIYDMCGSGGKMYWVSNVGLYQTDGVDSQIIKRKLFTSSARCSIYQDNFVYIIDGVEVCRFGTSLPGFPKPFVELYNHDVPLSAVNGSIFLESRSGGGTVDRVGFSGRASTGEIVTIPYDASALWADKNLEVICFPYELKTGNAGASIQIQMQTNLMELDNSSTFNNILTLSDLSNDLGICRIDVNKILDAMGSKTPNFSWVKFKIILNRSTSGEYTPKVYQDMFIAGSFLNDAKVIG